MSTLKKPLLMAAAAIVLGAGYFVAKFEVGNLAVKNQDSSHVASGHKTSSRQQTPASESPSTNALSVAMSEPITASPVTAPKIFMIRIPADPKVDIPIYRLHRGEEANFSAVSTVDGKLAIHGITPDMPVRKNQAMQFEIQAQHTGRFPMHVHGGDGSHLEVGVVEILPQ